MAPDYSKPLIVTPAERIGRVTQMLKNFQKGWETLMREDTPADKGSRAISLLVMQNKSLAEEWKGLCAIIDEVFSQKYLSKVTTSELKHVGEEISALESLLMKSDFMEAWRQLKLLCDKYEIMDSYFQPLESSISKLTTITSMHRKDVDELHTLWEKRDKNTSKCNALKREITYREQTLEVIGLLDYDITHNRSYLMAICDLNEGFVRVQERMDRYDKGSEAYKELESAFDAKKKVLKRKMQPCLGDEGYIKAYQLFVDLKAELKKGTFAGSISLENNADLNDIASPDKNDIERMKVLDSERETKGVVGPDDVIAMREASQQRHREEGGYVTDGSRKIWMPTSEAKPDEGMTGSAELRPQDLGNLTAGCRYGPDCSAANVPAV